MSAKMVASGKRVVMRKKGELEEAEKKRGAETHRFRGGATNWRSPCGCVSWRGISLLPQGRALAADLRGGAEMLARVNAADAGLVLNIYIYIHIYIYTYMHTGALMSLDG